MRNVAVAVARQLGFSGQRVAQVMGLSASYVATLHQRARREGAAGLVRPSGPKPKLSPQVWARAARWRQAGASEAQIAARLGVAQATVSRHLGGAGQQELPRRRAGPGEPSRSRRAQAARSRGAPASPAAAAGGGRARRRGRAARDRARDGSPGRTRAGGGARRWPAGGRGADHRGPGRPPGMRARCCCTRSAPGPGAGDILAAAGDGEPGGAAARRRGAAVGGQHLLRARRRDHRAVQAPDRGAAGPLAGMASLPGLRTLRPRLAAIADGTDPLELQAMFAQRCWPPTRSPPGCTTSTTISCPTPGPSRSARAGTTSAARPRRAAPTRM